MKNILVTGGTSYIGKHVIAQLIEKDYSVRTTVRDKSKVEEIKSDIEKHLSKQISLDLHIADLLNDGSMNITNMSGTLYHPRINLNTTNTFAVPTKIWIKAGTQTATRKEILVARSWVNPVRDVEEFIEFMTINKIEM